MKFTIEQIAICPRDPAAARVFLSDLGLSDWVHDTVDAVGIPGNSTAELSFNYQGGCEKPLEFEVLHYVKGDNWMAHQPPRVSHLGMHVTEEELQDFDVVMRRWNVAIAQAVATTNHTNPAIAGKRWYKYVIYDTFPLLGVDLKFIIRKEEPAHG